MCVKDLHLIYFSITFHNIKNSPLNLILKNIYQKIMSNCIHENCNSYKISQLTKKIWLSFWKRVSRYITSHLKTFRQFLFNIYFGGRTVWKPYGLGSQIRI